MAMHLALYTFGIFARPSDDPANDGFHALDAQIWPLLDRAEGLVARSGYIGDPGPRSWGPHVYPDFYVGEDAHSPSTLSLWKSIEHAMAFAYHGLHKEALKRGREWMVKPQWPPYAAWWVEAGHRPDWHEAVQRHRHLHVHGSSATAFLFKQPFDEDGHAYEVDHHRVRKIAG